MEKLILVKFEKRCPPYNIGETAGFDEDVAQSLIKRGVAAPAQAPRKDAAKAS